VDTDEEHDEKIERHIGRDENYLRMDSSCAVHIEHCRNLLQKIATELSTISESGSNLRKMYLLDMQDYYTICLEDSIDWLEQSFD